MNKEEIERRIKKYELVRECAEEKLNELNIQLCDLREAEKPKLRHGDFGINKNGFNRITFLKGRDRDDYCSEGIVNDSEITVFGNIFDLMKYWGEDFGKDNWRSEKGKDGQNIMVGIEEGGIWLGTCGNSDIYSEEIAYEIWRKLGQMIMTLKKNSPQE